MTRNYRNILVGGLAVGVCLAFVVSAAADELRRRGMIGVRLGAVTDEVRERLDFKLDGGVHIVSTTPDSAATEAGLQADDIILKLDKEKVADREAFSAMSRRYYGGDTVEYTVWRQGQELVKKVKLLPQPMETSDEFEIIYDAAPVDGKQVRTIITRPKAEGKYPAVMLIQDFGARSIDYGMWPPTYYPPLKRIVDGLTQDGVVTMRVELIGTGDSDGVDTRNTPLQTDLKTFSSALKKLKSYEYVDADNVVILGHGMGGATTPLVAKEVPVRGIVTFGVFARPWEKHFTETLRRIWEFDGVSKEEMETNTKHLKTFIEQCLRKKQPIADVLAANPDMREFATSSLQLQEDTYVYGRHYSYFQDLAAIDLGKAWAEIDAEVLAVWGEADFVGNRADSEYIAKMVNSKHPGSATFVALAEIDHHFMEHEEQEDSYDSIGYGSPNPNFLELLQKWLKEGTKSP